MTFYTDPAFYVLAAVALIPAVALGLAEKRQLKPYGLVVSALFLVLLFSDDAPSGAAFAIFVVWSCILARWVLHLFAAPAAAAASSDSEGAPPAPAAPRASAARTSGTPAARTSTTPAPRAHTPATPHPRAVALYRLALVLQICPLAAAKILGLFDISLVGFIGISYITFKAVQVLIEIRDGLIDTLPVQDYLYFLLFFPPFTSGPILRSRDFMQQINAPAPRAQYVDALAQGAIQMLKGFVYTFLFAGLFQWLMWFAPEAIGTQTAPAAALSAVSEAFFYGLYLFFDFAGYSSMAIGLGAAFGVRVPVNFNAPFLSIDIKDFWNRWHMSLSFWLRDYVFMRMSKGLIRARVFKSRTTTACVGFLAEMALMGVWHGITLSCITYGLYHGLLLAGCELFQKKSKFYKAHKKQRWFKICSWAVTMLAIFFGFSIFSGQFWGDILGG